MLYEGLLVGWIAQLILDHQCQWLCLRAEPSKDCFSSTTGCENLQGFPTGLLAVVTQIYSVIHKENVTQPADKIVCSSYYFRRWKSHTPKLTHNSLMNRSPVVSTSEDGSHTVPQNTMHHRCLYTKVRIVA